jgi:hypothetical protein
MSWFHGLHLMNSDMIRDKNKLLIAFNLRLKRLQLKNPKFFITPQTLTNLLAGYQFDVDLALPTDSSQFLSEILHHIDHNRQWKAQEVRDFLPYLRRITELPEVRTSLLLSCLVPNSPPIPQVAEICNSLLVKLERGTGTSPSLLFSLLCLISLPTEIMDPEELEDLKYLIRSISDQGERITLLESIVNELCTKNNKISSSLLSSIAIQNLLQSGPQNIKVVSSLFRQMESQGRHLSLINSSLRTLLIPLSDVNYSKYQEKDLSDFITSLSYQINRSKLTISRLVDLPSLKEISSSSPHNLTELLEELLSKVDSAAATAGAAEEEEVGNEFFSLYLENLHHNQITLSHSKMRQLISIVSHLHEGSAIVQQGHLLISHHLTALSAHSPPSSPSPNSPPPQKQQLQQQQQQEEVIELLKVFSISDQTKSGREALSGMVRLLDDPKFKFSIHDIAHCLRLLSRINEMNPDFNILVSVITSHLQRFHSPSVSGGNSHWTPLDIAIACQGLDSHSADSPQLRAVIQLISQGMRSPSLDSNSSRGMKSLSWIQFCSLIKRFQRLDSSHSEVRALLASLISRTSLPPKKGIGLINSPPPPLQSWIDLLSGLSGMNSHHQSVQTILSLFIRAYSRAPSLGTFSMNQLEIAFVSLKNKPLQDGGGGGAGGGGGGGGGTIEIYRLLHSHLCRCLEHYNSDTALPIDTLCHLLSGLSACEETHPLTNELFSLIASYLPSYPSPSSSSPSSSLRLSQTSLLHLSQFLSGRSLLSTSSSSLSMPKISSQQDNTEVYLKKLLLLLSTSLKADHATATSTTHHSLPVYFSLLSAVQRMSLNFSEVREVLTEIAGGLTRALQLQHKPPNGLQSSSNEVMVKGLAEAGLAFASLSQIHHAISIHHLTGSSSMNSTSSPLSALSGGGLMNSSRLLYQLLEALLDSMNHLLPSLSSTASTSTSSVTQELLWSLTLMDHYTADLPQTLLEKYHTLLSTLRATAAVSSQQISSLVYQETLADGTEISLSPESLTSSQLLRDTSIESFVSELRTIVSHHQLSLHGLDSEEKGLCQAIRQHTGVPVDILITTSEGTRRLWEWLETQKTTEQSSQLQSVHTTTTNNTSSTTTLRSLASSLSTLSRSTIPAPTPVPPLSLTSLQQGTGALSGMWCIQLERVDRHLFPREKRRNFLTDLYLQRAFGIEVNRISLQSTEELRKEFLRSLEDSLDRFGQEI